MKAVEKENLSEKAYTEIKKQILDGTLKQGQVISVNAMAESLKISRTPVTNACQKLEYEKLLTVIPKQGVVIHTLSLEEACGIYELRAAIESYNAKRVMDRLTVEDISILKQSVDKQAREAQAGNHSAFMDEDHFFHRYLLQKNMNRELLCVINQLYDRAYMLGIKNSSASRLTESISEHRKILAALDRKDKQAFADAIEENILNGFRSLTKRFLQ